METKTAVFFFYDDLNDFLRRENRGKPVTTTFKGNQSAKHLIESLHIPHTEVGRLQVDGQDVDLGYLVQDGDRLKVFPPAPGAGKTGEPLRFLLDGHLGKLATYLRLLGFDAVYQNDFQDDELAELAARGGQILLSRDRGLLMRNAIRSGYCLRSLDPKQQLLEVMQRYGLVGDIHPFQRCLRCNARLQRVEKALILDQLEPLTRQYFDEFHRCPDCGQIYWKGSHYEHMQAFLQKLSDL